MNIFLARLLPTDLVFRRAIDYIINNKTTYMSEKVVVNLHPSFGSNLSEMVRWADKKVIAHYVPDHFLIQIPVVYVLPIRVLERNKKKGN